MINDQSDVIPEDEKIQTEALHNSWSIIEPSHGNPPFERANHTCVLTQDKKLIIYGGHDSIGNTLNDLIIYDINRNCWSTVAVNRMLKRHGRRLVISDKFPNYHIPTALEPSPPPPARSYHTAILYQNFMCVFGGNSDEIDGRVYVLEITKLTWTVCVTSSAPSCIKKPRFQHTAVLWGNNMVIYGGTNGNSLHPPIISMLDLVKFKWSTLPTNLPPMYAHSAFIKEDMMFLVGGQTPNPKTCFNIVSLIDGSTIAASNYFPESLMVNRRLLTVTYDSVHDQLFIFGGYTINKDGAEIGCSNHLDIVDFALKSYGTLYSELCDPGPTPKCGHTAVLHEGCLYIFGGCDRLPLLNGEWVFCDFSVELWKFLPPAYMPNRVFPQP